VKLHLLLVLQTLAAVEVVEVFLLVVIKERKTVQAADQVLL
jgi:hypothetical protein